MVGVIPHIKTRVMVVDDSVVIRKLLKSVISEEQDMEVIAVAPNGNIALKKMEQLSPDVITMDLDMPELDGVQTLREMRAKGLNIPVIMVSAATDIGAEKTLDCLSAGADDFILKPKNLSSFQESFRLIRVELLPKIRALRPKIESPKVPEPEIHEPIVLERPVERASVFKAIVIASSTGGPAALELFFQNLNGPVTVPIFITQHMPPTFTANLAKRMNEKFKLRFQEGRDGNIAKPGQVYIAPGGFHMKLESRDGEVVILNNTDPHENYCRPAADVLFRSAAKIYGNKVIGVVLTGMGRDGASGATTIASCGGPIYVQDEASSVVWGMPGSVVESGCVHEILSIPEITVRIQNHLRGARHV